MKRHKNLVCNLSCIPHVSLQLKDLLRVERSWLSSRINGPHDVHLVRDESLGASVYNKKKTKVE